MEVENLNIINWNARSLKANIMEFNNFLEKYKIDIAAVTETHLNSNIKIYIPNYKVIRKDRNDRKGGGVALIIKNNIKFEYVLDLELKVIESVGIKIRSQNGKITIFSIYMPKNCTIKNGLALKFKNDLKKMTSISGKFLIIGDLNAKHDLWNNKVINMNGKIVSELLNSRSLFYTIPRYTYIFM